MQVHCDEGVANHIGPEPCAGIREGVGEASAGERTGQPLSRDSTLIPGADAVPEAEGNTDGRVIASARPTRRGRRPWHVRTLLAREPGDLAVRPVGAYRAGPHREGEEPKPMMNGPEKSDSAIVAVKPANKAGQPAAEWVEPRAGTEGNAGQPRTRRTQSRDSVSQGLDRVRQAARQRKKETVHRAAAPCDGRSAAGRVLGAQAPCGAWGGRADVAGLRGGPGGQPRGPARTGPSRQRTGHCPSGEGTYRSRTGEQRPLGIAALEDKIVQRAVVAVLNAIYEEDFLGFSYGFRPGRSQHDALDALAVGDLRDQGELDSRRRHSRLLRLGQPGLAGPFHGASDRRRAHHPPCAQVAQGGRAGRRESERQ